MTQAEASVRLEQAQKDLLPVSRRQVLVQIPARMCRLRSSGSRMVSFTA